MDAGSPWLGVKEDVFESTGVDARTDMIQHINNLGDEGSCKSRMQTTYPLRLLVHLSVSLT